MTTGTALVVRRPRRPRLDKRRARRLIGSGLQFGVLRVRPDGTEFLEFRFSRGVIGRFYPALMERVRIARSHPFLKEIVERGDVPPCA